MRKPRQTATTVATFVLLSIAGGFSFVLPADLSRPDAATASSAKAGRDIVLLAFVRPTDRPDAAPDTFPIRLSRDDSGTLVCRLERFEPLAGRSGGRGFTCLIDAEFTKARGEGRAFLEFVGGGGAHTEIYLDDRRIVGDGAAQADLLSLGLPDDERHRLRFAYHGRHGSGGSLLRIRTNLELTPPAR